MLNNTSTTPVAGAAAGRKPANPFARDLSVESRPPLPAEGWYQLQAGKHAEDGLIVRMRDGKPVFFPDTDTSAGIEGAWVFVTDFRYNEPADFGPWWTVWFASILERSGIAAYVAEVDSAEAADAAWKAAVAEARQAELGADGLAWLEMAQAVKPGEDVAALSMMLSTLGNQEGLLGELSAETRRLFEPEPEPVAEPELIQAVPAAPPTPKVGGLSRKAPADGALPAAAAGPVAGASIASAPADGAVDKAWQHGYGEDPWTTTGWWGTVSGRKAALAFQEAQRNASKAMSQQDGIALLRGLFQA